MALTYENINTATLGSATSTIVIGSIPATYTHLIVTGNVSFTAASTQTVGFVYINGDTSMTGYQFQQLAGDSTTLRANARSDNAGWLFWMYGNTQNTFDNSFVMEFPQYSNTSVARTAIMRSGNSNLTEHLVARVATANAVNSITISTGNNGNFNAGSNFSVWGVLKA